MWEAVPCPAAPNSPYRTKDPCSIIIPGRANKSLPYKPQNSISPAFVSLTSKTDKGLASDQYNSFSSVEPTAPKSDSLSSSCAKTATSLVVYKVSPGWKIQSVLLLNFTGLLSDTYPGQRIRISPFSYLSIERTLFLGAERTHSTQLVGS